MSATVEIFSEHGIDTTEEEIAQAVRAAFDDFPQLSVTALPHDEAAVYDEAGMVEDVPAYRRKVLQRVGRHVALVEQSVPVAEAAAVLGVSRSRVQQMISARTVWALRGPG
ncbi:MAG: hypothetical protein ACRDP4_12865, partial [Nocardioidaceae bacterium]